MENFTFRMENLVKTEIYQLLSDFVCCMENFFKSFRQQSNVPVLKILYASCKNL